MFVVKKYFLDFESLDYFNKKYMLDGESVFKNDDGES
jgi:hypothetical protein